MSKKVRKRTGKIVEFDENRIQHAVQKASDYTKKIARDLVINDGFSKRIAKDVSNQLEKIFYQESQVPSIEDIQDIVERTLVESGYFEVARVYILYRADHTKKREKKRIEELKKLDKELISVTKRDGNEQRFDINKIKKVFQIASNGLEDQCDFKDYYDLFKLSIIDGIRTKDITRNLKKTAIDMVTVDNINWQIIAGRLLVMELYKEASRNRKTNEEEVYSANSFKKHFDDYIDQGLYYKDFYSYYTEDEIIKAGKYIDPKRDFTYIYSTVLAFSKRYLLNPNKIIHELPQEMYMAVALFLAIPEKQENRFEIAKQIYDVTSLQKLSLPTPTLLNARTNYHQLSSCFKLNVGDDLRAIYHSVENMAQISKFGGGVGVYLGHIRSKGAAIRGVKGASGGVIPWTRVINDTACAVNQLGSRLGAISPTLDIWHKDILDFLNLQTETGDIRSKAFDIFPSISVPDLFMKRVEKDLEWTLFDPYEVSRVTGKRIEDLFGLQFESFYESCEKNEKIEIKEKIKAKDLLKVALKATVETGMPYFFFRDTVNQTNPNKHVGNIYSTQLCTEICQNTSDSEFISETEDSGDVNIKYKAGDTVVCNLASINIAKVHTNEEIKKVFPIALRVLDNVITLNFYPIKEAELTAKKYRSVGLGFMGLAEYLACNKLMYDSKEACEHVDELFEQYAYATLYESNKLAEERGEYKVFRGSDWSKGILFGKDELWYKKNSNMPEKWSALIKNIKESGLRFAYHLAPAPNTSTAGVVGTTAGLLPLYKKFFVETNVIAPTITVAPNLSKENFWYYKEYINLNMSEVIDMISVIYKWIDQSASFEWLINPENISPYDLYTYYMKAWKKKIKTVYYLRSMSAEVKDSCESCSG